MTIDNEHTLTDREKQELHKLMAKSMAIYRETQGTDFDRDVDEAVFIPFLYLLIDALVKYSKQLNIFTIILAVLTVALLVTSVFNLYFIITG